MRRGRRRRNGDGIDMSREREEGGREEGRGRWSE